MPALSRSSGFRSWRGAKVGGQKGGGGVKREGLREGVTERSQSLWVKMGKGSEMYKADCRQR